jgi:hypothetical protein
VNLNKFVIFVIVLLIGWDVVRIVFFPAPERLPQFKEHAITFSGSYSNPQWSSDSRYLAYLDAGRSTELIVYDTLTNASWTAARDVSGIHFSWTTDGNLSYIRDRPDLSGSPFPMIYDMYRANLYGGNERVIAENLSSPSDFDWFSDGIQLAILLTDPTIRNNDNDIYLLNTTTDDVEILLEAEALGLEFITAIVLSPNEKSLLIYGIGGLVDERATATSAQLVLYDLETETIQQRINPSELMRPGNATYPWPGIGDASNATWAGSGRWYLAGALHPDTLSQCYNYSLYFFDLEDLQNSFCIPSVIGIVAHPVVSPDLTKISYVTVVGPGVYYLMLGTLPPDLVTRLEE